MKGIRKRLLFIPALLCFSTYALAKDVVVISGLAAASRHHHESINDYYIQIGKFHRLADAERNKQLIKSAVIYPVNVKKLKGYYTISVGPIHTAPDVRATAQNIQHRLQPAPVQVVVAKKPIVSHSKVIAHQTLPVPLQHSEVKYQQHVSGKPYFAVGAGDMFYNVQGSNSLGTGAGWPNDKYVTNNISNQMYGFVAGGYTWLRTSNWLPNYSLGLRYMYVPATSITGHIDQYSLPAFNNYNYSYDVSLLNILATMKVDVYRWQNVMPYLMLGAGVSSVFTSDYTEQATNGVTPRVSPDFGGNAANNFAYQAGVGIDYVALENMWINLEWNYANYGTINTGKGANYSTLTGTNYDNESLKNKLSSTTVFLGLTYYPA